MRPDATLVDYGRRLEVMVDHVQQVATMAGEEVYASYLAIGRIAARMAAIRAKEMQGVLAQVAAIEAMYGEDELLEDCEGAVDLALVKQIVGSLQKMRRAR